MSLPFSRILHPFEIPSHPSLEPEVKQATLASWALIQPSAAPRDGHESPSAAEGDRTRGGGQRSARPNL
jgi:hypothetical protein